MNMLIGMAALSLAAALAVPAVAQDDAATLYKMKCQVCHGADGKGSPTGTRLGVKAFHSPEVAKESDADLATIVKDGKGKMPKYDGKLTDDQIKSLVKYIRTLK
jgi:mono/diheme cytochrome c family protein